MVTQEMPATVPSPTLADVSLVKVDLSEVLEARHAALDEPQTWALLLRGCEAIATLAPTLCPENADSVVTALHALALDNILIHRSGKVSLCPLGNSPNTCAVSDDSGTGSSGGGCSSAAAVEPFVPPECTGEVEVKCTVEAIEKMYMYCYGSALMHALSYNNASISSVSAELFSLINLMTLGPAPARPTLQRLTQMTRTKVGQRNLNCDEILLDLHRLIMGSADQISPCVDDEEFAEANAAADRLLRDHPLAETEDPTPISPSAPPPTDSPRSSRDHTPPELAVALGVEVSSKVDDDDIGRDIIPSPPRSPAQIRMDTQRGSVSLSRRSDSSEEDVVKEPGKEGGRHEARSSADDVMPDMKEPVAVTERDDVAPKVEESDATSEHVAFKSDVEVYEIPPVTITDSEMDVDQVDDARVSSPIGDAAVPKSVADDLSAVVNPGGSSLVDLKFPSLLNDHHEDTLSDSAHVLVQECLDTSMHDIHTNALVEHCLSTAEEDLELGEPTIAVPLGEGLTEEKPFSNDLAKEKPFRKDLAEEKPFIKDLAEEKPFIKDFAEEKPLNQTASPTSEHQEPFLIRECFESSSLEFPPTKAQSYAEVLTERGFLKLEADEEVEGRIDLPISVATDYHQAHVETVQDLSSATSISEQEGVCLGVIPVALQSSAVTSVATAESAELDLKSESKSADEETAVVLPDMNVSSCSVNLVCEHVNHVQYMEEVAADQETAVVLPDATVSACSADVVCEDVQTVEKVVVDSQVEDRAGVTGLLAAFSLSVTNAVVPVEPLSGTVQDEESHIKEDFEPVVDLEVPHVKVETVIEHETFGDIDSNVNDWKPADSHPMDRISQERETSHHHDDEGHLVPQLPDGQDDTMDSVLVQRNDDSIVPSLDLSEEILYSEKLCMDEQHIAYKTCYGDFDNSQLSESYEKDGLFSSETASPMGEVADQLVFSDETTVTKVVDVPSSFHSSAADPFIPAVNFDTTKSTKTTSRGPHKFSDDFSPDILITSAIEEQPKTIDLPAVPAHSHNQSKWHSQACLYCLSSTYTAPSLKRWKSLHDLCTTTTAQSKEWIFTTPLPRAKRPTKTNNTPESASTTDRSFPDSTLDPLGSSGGGATHTKLKAAVAESNPFGSFEDIARRQHLQISGELTDFSLDSPKNSTVDIVQDVGIGEEVEESSAAQPRSATLPLHAEGLQVFKEEVEDVLPVPAPRSRGDSAAAKTLPVSVETNSDVSDTPTVESLNLSPSHDITCVASSVSQEDITSSSAGNPFEQSSGVETVVAKQPSPHTPDSDALNPFADDDETTIDEGNPFDAEEDDDEKSLTISMNPFGDEETPRPETGNPFDGEETSPERRAASPAKVAAPLAPERNRAPVIAERPLIVQSVEEPDEVIGERLTKEQPNEPITPPVVHPIGIVRENTTEEEHRERIGSGTLPVSPPRQERVPDVIIADDEELDSLPAEPQFNSSFMRRTGSRRVIPRGGSTRRSVGGKDGAVTQGKQRVSANKKHTATTANGTKGAKTREMMGPEFDANKRLPSIRIRLPAAATKRSMKDFLEHPRDALPLGKSGATAPRNVVVMLLSGQRVDVACSTTSLVSEVFDGVVGHCNLSENYLFGLTHLKDNEHFFLDPDARISKTAPSGWKENNDQSNVRVIYTLYLRLKFYPDTLSIIRNELTFHQLFLQLRRDIIDARLQCDRHGAYQLAALALQAEYGDRPTTQENGETVPAVEYFKVEYYLPPRFLVDNTTGTSGHDRIRRVLAELHSQYAGLARPAAEQEFLETCQKLREYGIHFHRVFKSKPTHGLSVPTPLGDPNTGTSIWIGLMPKGVLVFEERSGERVPTSQHPWHQTHTLQYSRRKFIILPKTTTTDSEAVTQRLVFYTDGHKKSGYFVRFAAQQHKFCMKLRGWKSTDERQRSISRQSDRSNVVAPAVHGRQTSSTDDSGCGTTHSGREDSPDVKSGVQVNGNASASVSQTPTASAVLSPSEYQLFKARMRKQPSGSLGLTLVDGEIQGVRGVYVKCVTTDGPACLQGRLRMGDRITSINGSALSGMGRHEAVDLVRDAGESVEMDIQRLKVLNSSNESLSARDQRLSTDTQPDTSIAGTPQGKGRLYQKRTDKDYSRSQTMPTRLPPSTTPATQQDSDDSDTDEHQGGVYHVTPLRNNRTVDDDALVNVMLMTSTPKPNASRSVTDLHESAISSSSTLPHQHHRRQPSSPLVEVRRAPSNIDVYAGLSSDEDMEDKVPPVPTMNGHSTTPKNATASYHTNNGSRNQDWIDDPDIAEDETYDYDENQEFDQFEVQLFKNARGGLGIKIAGGGRIQRPVYVKALVDEPAISDPNIRQGDLLVAVNNRPTSELTHQEVVQLLRNATSPVVLSLKRPLGPGRRDSVASSAEGKPTIQQFDVYLDKPAHGSLGLSLARPQIGAGAPDGVYVRVITPGSVADVDGTLRVGDRLWSIDGQSVERDTPMGVVGKLRVAMGRVHLVVKREVVQS